MTLLLVVAMAAVNVDGAVPVRDPEPVASPAREALREGQYPWYDDKADRVRPVWPIKVSWLDWLGKRIEAIGKAIARFLDRFKFGGGGLSIPGNMIGTGMLLAALLAFFVFIVMLWIRRDAGAFARESERIRLGRAARVGDLPEGIRPGDGDPWAEAQRRRASGDLSGAIVALFAHQLLTLDQLGLIRLAPGRTGRHYVHGLRDRDLVDSVSATLRLFEDVYYGRRAPTAEAFESVWARAQVFQERRRVLNSGALS
jgi:hypothetical protein